jgi:hypothetical protein
MPWNHGRGAVIVLFGAGLVVEAQAGFALFFIRTVTEKAVLAQDGTDLLGEMDGRRCRLCNGRGNERKSDEEANHFSDTLENDGS